MSPAPRRLRPACRFVWQTGIAPWRIPWQLWKLSFDLRVDFVDCPFDERAVIALFESSLNKLFGGPEADLNNLIPDFRGGLVPFADDLGLGLFGDFPGFVAGLEDDLVGGLSSPDFAFFDQLVDLFPGPGELLG